jgi:hypothetical protein
MNADVIRTELAAIQLLEKRLPVMALNEAVGVRGKMISTIDRGLLRDITKVAVVKGYISAGYKYEVTEVSFLIDSLVTEMLRVFPAIRDTEVSLAIHKGVMREYPEVSDYRGFSLATFVSFIRCYLSSPKRADEIKRLQGLPSDGEVKIIPSKEDLRKAARVLICEAFETYKAVGNFRDHGNYIYERLEDFDMLRFTDEEKISTWKKAYENMLKEYGQLGRTTDETRENRKIKAEIEADKKNIRVINERKRLRLNLYFDNLIAIDADIRDYLPEEDEQV